MAYRPVLLLLMALLLTLCCHCASVTQDKETLQFLQSFAKNYPVALASWTGTDYCKGWKYISCYGNNKVDLNIHDVQLDATGTLPEVTSDGISITDIMLWDCFSAPTPLPSTWHRLSRLTTLTFKSYYITGTLPALWGALSKLTTLQVRETSITGTLPSEWSALSSALWIILGSSPFTGTLPETWSALSNVSVIELFNTSITGTLPDAWRTLPKVEWLWLPKNAISGTLPASWGYRGSFPSLTGVALNDNNLCGCEPDSWKTIDVLHEAVVNTSLASANCSTANACGGSVTERPEEPNKNGATGRLSGAAAALAAACTMALGLSL